MNNIEFHNTSKKMTPEALMESLQERHLVNVVANILRCSRNSVGRRILSQSPGLALKRLEAIRVATKLIEDYNNATKEADSLLENTFENTQQMQAA